MAIALKLCAIWLKPFLVPLSLFLNPCFLLICCYAGSMLLTAERLLHYQRCNRRTFLDVYGNPTEKAPISDFQVKLSQERLAHQQKILEALILKGASPPHQPNYHRRDWKAGAKATLELMQQGVERIYQGVLLTTMEVQGRELISSSESVNPEQVTLISHPDLLIKQPGQSDFGDWLYVPLDIHLGKRPKQEYQIIAAYHTQLVASLQGAWPEKAWLNLRGKGEYEVDLWRWLPQMQIVLDECLQMLLEERSPEVFISRQQCSLCPWLSQCYAIAKSQQHLSLIPGVTPSRYQYLQTVGLTTLEVLAEANPVYLEPELETKIAHQMVQQAKSVLEQRAFLLPDQFTNPTLNLPTAPIELYFDIEAEPSINLDYLLGVLVIDRQAKTEKFYPLVAEHPDQEAFIWQQFLELVWTYPEAPIFHFANYEMDTIKRLAKLYQTPDSRVNPVLDRLVDIHEYVTEKVTLPVEGYSLKAIASWIGFTWRDPQANGSQSICWYDDWLKTGDRNLLDAILRYNEDDCRATYQVKDWLANFLNNCELTSREVIEVSNKS